MDVCCSSSVNHPLSLPNTEENRTNSSWGQGIFQLKFRLSTYDWLIPHNYNNLLDLLLDNRKNSRRTLHQRLWDLLHIFHDALYRSTLFVCSCWWDDFLYHSEEEFPFDMAFIFGPSEILANTFASFSLLLPFLCYVWLLKLN